MQNAIMSGPTRPEYWDTIFDAVPFPIYVVDIARLELINANRAMRLKSGAQAGDKCYRAIYGRQAPCIFCPIEQLSSAPQPLGASVILEYFNDVDDRWYQLQESLISWFDGRVAKYSIAVDISRLKETQNALAEAHAELSLKSKELERLVATDEVTGLCNRRRLYDILTLEAERSKRYASPVSIFIVDIDKFKSVNDSFGHQVGDQVLQGIASILRHGVRKVDTVGRWGGEEFIVICPNTVATDAVNLAEKLRAAIHHHVFPLGGRQTCSFGVAELKENETCEKLFGRADAALYRAKEFGRDRVELDL
jgi:diguanylate cyclase (GGDEF)-like protein